MCAHAQEGFVLTDFPNSKAEAESLEEFKGGVNAFVHLSLPDEILIDIEENKMKCNSCGRKYFVEAIVDEERGIHIEPFMPKDGTCHDCGSTDIREGGDPIQFEKELEQYKASKDELLSFYDHYGLLVDFEVKKGYEDYEKLKKKIQYGAKH